MGFGGMYSKIVCLLSLVLFLSASASTETLKVGRSLYEFDGGALAQMRNLVSQKHLSMDNLIALNFPDALDQDYKTLSNFKSELAQLLFHSKHQEQFAYHVNEDFMLISSR